MNANARLRGRRLLSVGGYLCLLLVLGAAALERSGSFGNQGDDWSRFDRQPVVAHSVFDGQRFAGQVNGEPVTVRLLGVDAPAAAKSYLTARLANRTVTLKLDGTQTRDDAGNLLAYIYVTDADLLNADIVRDGQAFADRRVRHTFASSIESVEREARAKKRGMWKDMRDEDQPEWRREWLKSLRESLRNGKQ